MKKVIYLIICLLLLTGCTTSNKNKLCSDFDSYLSDLSQTYRIRINRSAKYYDYYLPSDMQDGGGDANSTVIHYNNAQIIMNLNIANIVKKDTFGINSSIDDGFFNSQYLIYSNNGQFIKNDSTDSLYSLKVYSNDNEYLQYLVTDDLVFYCLSDIYDAFDCLKHMFIIAKSCNANRDAIIENYSNKDVIDFVRRQVDLFEYDSPDSGLLSELVSHSGGTVEIEELPQIEQEEIAEEGEIEVSE